MDEPVEAEGDDEQAVRSILGRLLFSQDTSKSQLKCFPVEKKGGCFLVVNDAEAEHSDHGRTDQPPGLESIESLNMALELYQGTLIFFHTTVSS